MAECIICQIIEGTVPSKKIYEDDVVVGFLDFNGASEGHTILVPKAHYPIFEQVPDEIIDKIFVVANKISSALFDALGVSGTNIYVANGVHAGQSVAHFVVHIIPRSEGDGIDLQWQPRQLSEEEMSTVELKIKEHAEHVGVDSSTTPNQSVSTTPKKPIKGHNYLWKSVNRRSA